MSASKQTHLRSQLLHRSALPESKPGSACHRSNRFERRIREKRLWSQEDEQRYSICTIGDHQLEQFAHPAQVASTMLGGKRIEY